jgi:hypothetical protein
LICITYKNQYKLGICNGGTELELKKEISEDITKYVDENGL